MTRWKRLQCKACGGTGEIGRSTDTAVGDCPYCGSGFYYVSQNDRFAEYPGGRFLGRLPGTFAGLDAKGVPDYEGRPIG